MSFPIDDSKPLQNDEAIWTKIEDLKTKITYRDKVYNNFCGLNVCQKMV